MIEQRRDAIAGAGGVLHRKSFKPGHRGGRKRVGAMDVAGMAFRFYLDGTERAVDDDLADMLLLSQMRRGIFRIERQRFAWVWA